MPYVAPVKDMLFVMNELAGLSDVVAYPSYAAAGSGGQGWRDRGDSSRGLSLRAYRGVLAASTRGQVVWWVRGWGCDFLFQLKLHCLVSSSF